MWYFNSRDPYGPRYGGNDGNYFSSRFQFTRPLRAAIWNRNTRCRLEDFNSRDPYGPRFCIPQVIAHFREFQFTRPLRAAMPTWLDRTPPGRISIHATPTGRDLPVRRRSSVFVISIHATPTGRDACWLAIFMCSTYFNSRDPYGPRWTIVGCGRFPWRFQFTRPLRAAIAARFCTPAPPDFNSRDPTGRDRVSGYKHPLPGYFNSRDPYGPRCVSRSSAMLSNNFNSRDPYGPRCSTENGSSTDKTFQFTRPLRAAMDVGEDFFFPGGKFQFTRPLRAAIVHESVNLHELSISIHATPTGRDLAMEHCSVYAGNFNSRDPYGPRSVFSTKNRCPEYFNSRDPYGPRSHQRTN